MKRILLALMIIVIIPAIAFCTPGVTPKKAVWNANTEADVAGYFIYWGASNQNYNNTDRVDVGNVTEYNLDSVPGPKIALTCYDTSGNESEYSNDVNLDNTAPSRNETLSVESQ